MGLQPPVAFIIFNRPQVTARVFARIAQARPERLLVIADGPRPTVAGEAEQCAAARAVVEQVNWPCQVETNFSATNLGCKQRVSSGLDWVFDRCEEAIILEDDCLPDPTFFRYCRELLERYRDNPEVMSISGHNCQFGLRHDRASYFFTRFVHIWGWASWRRAWKHYDVTLRQWPSHRDNPGLKPLLGCPEYIPFWTDIFDRCYQGKLNTWDYQWEFAHMVNGGVSISPAVNLVRNLGLMGPATHTANAPSWFDIPTREMTWPLKHPQHIQTIRKAEIRDFRATQLCQSPWERRERLWRTLHRWGHWWNTRLPAWNLRQRLFAGRESKNTVDGR